MPVPILPQRPLDDGRLSELNGMISKQIGNRPSQAAKSPRPQRSRMPGSQRRWPPPVRKVIHLAAACAGVPYMGILGGGSQRSHVVFARRAAICELRRMGYSAAAIGEFMDMHHTSILHNLRRGQEEALRLAAERNAQATERGI